MDLLFKQWKDMRRTGRAKYIEKTGLHFVKPTLLQMMNRLEGARMDAKGTSEEVTAVLLGREDEVQMERQRPS